MTGQHPAIQELKRIYSLEPKPDSWQVLHDWAVYELKCARLDNVVLRRLLDDDITAWREMWQSRNHWRLAAVFMGAMFVMALVMR